MLEIYNEQVRDLLVKNNPKGGLQVNKKNCWFLNSQYWAKFIYLGFPIHCRVTTIVCGTNQLLQAYSPSPNER